MVWVLELPIQDWPNVWHRNLVGNPNLRNFWNAPSQALLLQKLEPREFGLSKVTQLVRSWRGARTRIDLFRFGGNVLKLDFMIVAQLRTFTKNHLVVLKMREL